MENNDLKERNINDIISMANEGNVDAMNELGVRYINGEGVEKDEKKAFELFNSASKKDCIKAKFNLAMCYYNGNGIEQNDTVSFNILKELAEKYNHARSYYYLGEFYFFGGPVEIDYEKSFFYYNEALKINPKYLKAKLCIAYAYYSGKGIKKNYEIAFNMFKELAEENKFVDAYFYLGEFYYLGRVVQKDYKKAIEYFNEALNYSKNVYGSKYYLGEMYMFGKGVNADYQKAKMYFEDILNEKYDDAYYKLALINSGDFGIQKNEEKAKKYFNKIEFDLCMAMIYYVIAVKPEEEQNLDEILKLLDSEMEVVKQTIVQFPLNHPAKIYHDRLYYLKDEEYNDIVERLKNKIKICKKEKNLKDAIMALSSDSDVIDLVRCIVGYTDSLKNDNNESNFENNKKTILKFYRNYCIEDEETAQLMTYDKTEKDFYIEKDTILNIEGNNCNTKITIKNISNEFVELEIEDSHILTMESINEGIVNVKIEKGKMYEYYLPSAYALTIKIMSEYTDKNIRKLTIHNGNYLAGELIELERFNDILKCNYKQSQNIFSGNPKEENKYCEMSKEDNEYIITLIEKINFDEKVSDDDYLEGGGAGNLSIEYEDGTTLIKEFGSYMPKDINELYRAIINKLNSSDSINK